MDAIDRLLQGSIDMHAHFGPHPTESLCNALQGAQMAREAGMRAIVLKATSIVPHLLLISLVRPSPTSRSLVGYA